MNPAWYESYSFKNRPKTNPNEERHDLRNKDGKLPEFCFADLCAYWENPYACTGVRNDPDSTWRCSKRMRGEALPVDKR